MPGRQSANPAYHLPSQRDGSASRLTNITRYLVGYTVEEVERELILNSLDHYDGCRTHAANVLGISIRCMRNKIAQYTALGMMVTAPGRRNDLNDRISPDCVSCGLPMRFARSIPPGLGGSSESPIFHCEPCGLLLEDSAVAAAANAGAVRAGLVN
jgi:hypothetical protein